MGQPLEEAQVLVAVDEALGVPLDPDRERMLRELDPLVVEGVDLHLASLEQRMGQLAAHRRGQRVERLGAQGLENGLVPRPGPAICVEGLVERTIQVVSRRDHGFRADPGTLGSGQASAFVKRPKVV